MADEGSDGKSLLQHLGDTIREDFSANRRVMSFAEYLDLCAGQPKQQLRSAPQYIKDCFEYYGSDEKQYPHGSVRRFRLFDCPWAEGRDCLIGQEEAQNRIYRSLTNFVNEGVANKLLLLHGPNGSAKSTLLRCIGRAMQEYSNTAEGALYRINWIFPSQKVSKSGIGFSGSGYEGQGHGDSYAYLPDEAIDAKLVDELKDHPIFLVPVGQREQLLGEWFDGVDATVGDYIRYGRLSHKNRAIYESLLTNYQGDYLKVLRHVQVERFFVRHRYRQGYVTVEPQLSVDAIERQLTADRSITALPAALQSVSLFEYGGELVHGNRGIIEYSDLLKRPIEAYKYLLSTVERASVSMTNATLFLDLFFVGTSNEIHMAAFKEHPDFQSFKGRLEFVRVPYLLDVAAEQQIYRRKLEEAAASRHIAPHTDYAAALWAVLTRLRKPMPDRYKKSISDVVEKLAPVAKADLYESARTPEALSAAEARELRASIKDIASESETYPNYEGRVGASPREMQGVLFNAANSSHYDYVSPFAVLEEIDELCKQTSVYPFLRQEVIPPGYHDHRGFVAQVRARIVDRMSRDFRNALGLVEETAYDRHFSKFITHVLHWTKKEKVTNPTTGDLEEPDTQLMEEVETVLGISDSKRDEFRRDIISKIGAWSLDHAKERPVYSEIFRGYYRTVKDSYFEERRRAIASGITDLRKFLTNDTGGMSAQSLKQAESSFERLRNDYGYIETSARDAAMVLLREVYKD